MRRIHLGVLLGALPVLALCLVVGCKSDEDSDPLAHRGKRPERHKGEGGGTGAAAVKLEPVDAGTATFSGRILLEGARPNTQELTAKLQEQMKTDHDYCMAGGPDAKEQQYRISDTDPATVGNVFVYFTPMEGQYFRISKAQLAGLKDVEIRQPYCAFRPHCTTIFSVYRNPANPEAYLATGEKLIAVNDATIGHNTKWASQENGGNSRTLAAKGGKLTIPGSGPDGALLPEAKPMQLECNIHGWMKAYVWPFDHPYATVSAAPDDGKSPEFGTFVIKNVPKGKVRVHVYHESGIDLFPDGEVMDFSKATGKVERDFKIRLK